MSLRTGMTTVHIEVDVMSGLPNPTFVLSASQAKALADALAALPGSGPDDVSAVLVLGFRGFVVTGISVSNLRGYDRVRVLGSRVIATEGHRATGRNLLDPHRSVYRLLRTIAEQHVNGRVLRAIPVDGVDRT